MGKKKWAVDSKLEVGGGAGRLEVSSRLVGGGRMGRVHGGWLGSGREWVWVREGSVREAGFLSSLSGSAGVQRLVGWEPKLGLLALEAGGERADELLQRLKESGRVLSPRVLGEMAEQAGVGLSALETAGIVHKRLSGSKCLVRRSNGRFCVTVSDLSQAEEESPELAEGVSDEKAVKEWRSKLFAVGSAWRWLAPESLKRRAFSSHSDVFAFGLVLYEFMTQGGTPYGIILEPEAWLEGLLAGDRVIFSDVLASPELAAIFTASQVLQPSSRPPLSAVVLPRLRAAIAALPSPSASSSHSDHEEDDHETFENGPLPSSTKSLHTVAS